MMRLTWRDGVATILVGGAAALYVAYLTGAGLPLVSGPRALAAVMLALGLAACIVGARDVSPDTNRTPYVRAMSTLGGVAFVAALITLITGWAAALAVLAGTTAVLWLAATVRHLVVPAQLAADRSRHGTNESVPGSRAGVGA